MSRHQPRRGRAVAARRRRRQRHPRPIERHARDLEHAAELAALQATIERGLL